MSAISLKSITGITSITTPAGVDNQLTLHNNNTTEAVKLDTAGNLHFHNHLNITGISTAANFKTGTSNLHNTGLNVFDLDVDGHTNLDNVSVSGVSTFSGIVAAGVGSTAITLDNSHKMTFGSAHELEMFHDGSNSYIKQRYIAYPSRLKIISENSGLDIMSGSGGNMHGGYENAISCELNGAVKIYHAGVGPYFETYGAGVIFQGNIQVGQDITHHTDGDTKIKFPLHNTISFETTGSERLRIHQNGQLLVGGVTAARTLLTNYTPRLQIEGTDKSSTSASLTANANSSVGPSLWFAKTRGTSIGSNTVVQDDDELGTIVFNGADGTDVQSMGAFIRASVDGTPGSNDMPGRLQFHTTADGSTSPTERLRITSTGKVGINYSSPVSIIHALGNSTVGTSVTMTLQSHDTANATAGIDLLARRNDNVNETCKIQAASGGQNSVDLQFHTNGGERLRITSGGAVMINTTNSSSRTLNLKGTFGILSPSQTGVIDMSVTDAGEASIGSYVAGGSALVLKTNASGSGVAERLRIKSDGNITFGHTSSTLAVTNARIKYISGGRDYWNGTKGDYRAMRFWVYDNAQNIDDVYGMGISSSMLEIQAHGDMGLFTGSAGTGTGRRNHRATLRDHGLFEFYNGTKLAINAATAPGTFGLVNIGYDAGTNVETRAIDIKGSWSGGENKSITFSHGTQSQQMVGQINSVHYGGTPSRTAPHSGLRFGKLYHNTDSSTYTMTLDSTSTTTADLNLKGAYRSTEHPAFSVAADSGQSDIGTTATKITYHSPSTIGRNQASCYDTTNDRFVAPVDGVYTFYVRHWFRPSATGSLQILLYRNGSQIKESRFSVGSGNPEYNTVQLTSTIFLSATNYIEVYGVTYSGSSTNVFHVSSGSFHTEFSGYLVC